MRQLPGGTSLSLRRAWRLPNHALARPGTCRPSDGRCRRLATERNRRREAEWIARRLRSMLDSGEPLVGDHAESGEAAMRAVRPGDITLLFRALTNVEYYEEALRRYCIDYYLVGGHAFYAQQEIFDIVNLLRAIASPCDEVSLAGILRSPMFGLLDETLYGLSKHEGGLSGGFWSMLEKVVSATLRKSPGNWPTNAPEEQTRVRFAAETLGELRAMKDRLPIARLLHKALEMTGYDALLLAEFMGERKLANLHKLIEQARQFDAGGIFTLADFITQLAQFVARQPDEPLAATQPESNKAVRLMSIHQSKGLEFPVVVVVDVARPRRGPTARWPSRPSLAPWSASLLHQRPRSIRSGRRRRGHGRTEPPVVRCHDAGRRLPDPLQRIGRSGYAPRPVAGHAAAAVRSGDRSRSRRGASSRVGPASGAPACGSRAPAHHYR